MEGGITVLRRGEASEGSPRTRVLLLPSAGAEAGGRERGGVPRRGLMAQPFAFGLQRLRRGLCTQDGSASWAWRRARQREGRWRRGPDAFLSCSPDPRRAGPTCHPALLLPLCLLPRGAAGGTRGQGGWSVAKARSVPVVVDCADLSALYLFQMCSTFLTESSINVAGEDSADFGLAAGSRWTGSSLSGGTPQAKKRNKPPAPGLTANRPEGKRLPAASPLAGWLLFAAWGRARLQSLRAFDSCLSPAT